MMKLLSIGIYYLIESIGLCDALPLRSVHVDERNMFLLGAFAFMTFGALLAGCVCCRRRKKGFELNKEKDLKEFKNEAENQRHGVPSIAITEATASTDTTRSTTPAAIIVSIPVVNNSNENLIVDNNDNNNGPISPADLENIENNNAFDYIENQNEIGITVEPPPSSNTVSSSIINQNLDSINDGPLSLIQDQIQMKNIQYQNENINSTNISNNNIQQDMPNIDIYNIKKLNVTQDIIITSTTNDINNSNLYYPNEISSISNENIKNLNSNSITNAEIHSIDEKPNNILNQLKEQHNQDKINIINNSNENSLNNNNTVQDNVPIFMKYQNEKDGNNLNDIDIIYKNLNKNDLKNIENCIILNDITNEEHNKNEDISKVLLAGLEDTVVGDSISIKSISSEKSNDNEITSVEEALRALDNAIESGLDDDNYDIGENEDKLQFIINSNENLIENKNNSNNKSTEIINIENDNDKNHIENVRIEAEELVNSVLNDRKKIIELQAIDFVDSLLNESKKIIEEKKQKEEDEKAEYDKEMELKLLNISLCSELEKNDINLNQPLPLSPTSPSSTTQTIAVNYFTIETNNICPNDILLNCAHDFDEMMLMKQKQKTQKQHQQTKTECNTNTAINFKQKLADFFANDMIVSSTPNVQNKFQKSNQNDINKCGIKLKFNDNDTLISPSSNNICELLIPLDDFNSENLIQNVTYNAPDATYNAADATYNAADKTYNAEADGTYNVENNKNNEIFDINKTFDADPIIKDDFTYPGDPCTSKQAMERDQFLRPLIKYQREEVTSDELNTITPVNTPIELNYNQETWDKMTKPNDDELKSGWFLHPQQLISKDNGCLGDGGIITQFENCNDEYIGGNTDENGDIDEEDSRNLESTFEALRKQLAEVLPQPQGIAGPPEFSDDDDDDQHSNRTFDEYRSPLDGIFGLLEIDNSTPTAAVQNNEVVINYNNKRPLSPIIEESEEETCKTFVLNETKCLDSTSTGCIETGEAIMGVTKTLMASNDTLFNFEDTLGDKEDVLFSPRLSSRSDSQATTPVKTSKSSTANNSITTTISSSDTEKIDNQNDLTYIHSTSNSTIHQHQLIQQQREPPKTLNFIDINELKSDNDFCSPDQQKTFSDGTTSTSTTTDRLSSSLSPTLDNETTFTLNTIDDKTCITVIIKDDERISDISEPEWGGSTISCGGGGGIVGASYDMNSLTDIPSLDFNVNTFDKEFEITDNLNDDDDDDNEMKKQNESISNHDNKSGDRKTSIEDDENTSIEDEIEIQKDSGHDDSGHSTQASTDKSNNTSHNISAQETDSIEDEVNNGNHYNQVIEFHNSTSNILNIIPKNINDFTPVNNDKKENCKEFLKNEIEYSSNIENFKQSRINDTVCENDNHDNKKSISIVDDSSKENSDPNVILKRLNNVIINNSFEEKITSKSVQMNSQDKSCNNKSTTDILDKEHYSINGSGNGIDFYPDKSKIEVFLPSQHDYNKLETIQQEKITPSSPSPILLLNSNSNNNYNNSVGSSNDEIIGHLSGEEDPWADTLNDIRFSGPGSADILSNSSEWDSDIDDSHSSEEFMYVRGDGVTSADGTILKYIQQDCSSSGIVDDYNDENNICHNDEKHNDNNIIQFVKNDKENFESNLWSLHKDKIPVSVVKESKIQEEECASEGSSSELEGEFIPSCWDSMAMPVRSSLKSPDKTNSSSDNKKCRSVVFKKQRYHSVYEYPRENTSLSPAFCGQNLWQNRNYVFKNYGNENTIEKFNDDGFVISSSSRPFHGSQFNALCHTWPTDSDFSWSQIESHAGDNKKLTSYSDIDLKWSPPQPLSPNDEIEIKDASKSDDSHRPDSGVGESAEMLSDRQSLGELCHTKTKLRLPIEEKLILPTSSSSCTGSMDSLSSSSSINSELQQQINQQQQEQNNEIPEKPKLNFSTFGKRNSFITTTTTNDNNEKRSTIINDNNYYDDIKKNDKINRPAINIILIDEINNTKLIQNNCSENFSNNSNNLVMKTDKIKQSDSTDEDSGIESIMKINKID